MHTAQRVYQVVAGRWFARVAGVLLALALLTSAALAAAPVTGTFQGRDPNRSMEINLIRPGETGLYHDYSGVLRLRLSTGQLVDVFCMQLFVAAINGRTYTSGNSVTSLANGCYIRALLAKHPASSATTALEGAAIQAAIWHFTDGLNLDTIYPRGQPTVTTLRDRAKALVAEAQADVAAAGGCAAVVATPRVESLTITPATGTGALGQPIAYTVTVAPANAASSVTVSVNGTALLGNGQKTATLALTNGSAAFNVTSPDGTPATVTASVPDTIDAGTLFNSPGSQQIVLGTALGASVSAQAQATWQQVTNTPTNTATATATATATVGTATATATVGTATATVGTATATATVGTATATVGTATATATVGTATATVGTATATATVGNQTSTPTDTPTTIIVITSTPNRRNTPTPGGGPEPSATATIVSETATTVASATATQVIAGDETATATPVIPNNAAAGGTAPVVPRSLPNTGTNEPDTGGWWLLVAVILASAGLALRRRSAR